MVTRAVEDYLKAIYNLQRGGSRATTNAIAAALNLRAASVTAMLQQLSEQGLAEYLPYKGAYLTADGLATALRVIRRHRLIELFLNRHLDVPWDCVHDEAERLEHAISPYLEERIDASLGYPSFDPHGAPIPTSSGDIPDRDLISLAELPPNTPSVVRHIPDNDPGLLRYAASIGIMPGTEVTVQGEAADGQLAVSISSDAQTAQSAGTREISRAVAARVFVEELPN